MLLLYTVSICVYVHVCICVIACYKIRILCLRDNCILSCKFSCLWQLYYANPFVNVPLSVIVKASYTLSHSIVACGVTAFISKGSDYDILYCVHGTMYVCMYVVSSAITLLFTHDTGATCVLFSDTYSVSLFNWHPVRHQTFLTDTRIISQQPPPPPLLLSQRQHLVNTLTNNIINVTGSINLSRHPELRILILLTKNISYRNIDYERSVLMMKNEYLRLIYSYIE